MLAFIPSSQGRKILSILGVVSLGSMPNVLGQSVLQRVDVSTSGHQADHWANATGISADGRFALFESKATNLARNASNGFTYQVYVRDRITGTTECVSVTPSGDPGNNTCSNSRMTPDGRYVVFDSYASDLVTGDGNGQGDVFVRDRVRGITERVSLPTDGVEVYYPSFEGSISDDGRYVAFASSAWNMARGDANNAPDSFVHDRETGRTERVSLSSSGTEADRGGRWPQISGDGRYVAFMSDASNLVPGDTNGVMDAFVRDRLTGTTERISISSTGEEGNAPSAPAVHPFSADGRYVLFDSAATNFAPGDSNGRWDVFVRDRLNGTTECVTLSPSGRPGNGESVSCGITPDARYVLFFSAASDLAGEDPNGKLDVFLRDRTSSTTEHVVRREIGIEPNDDSGFGVLTPDARFIAFSSLATNLIQPDTSSSDVFVLDRRATGFSSSCSPGIDGVLPCPCSNDAAGPGRGCDNSSATGGAVLSADGVAYLSMDSLVLRSVGEPGTALSLVVQGRAPLATGAIYGRGVRCVDGPLVRLYSKVASGGSVVAPDVSAGDPSISLRSEAKGDRIRPGESRWYFVDYRDPVPLAGCPRTSTFNATQTGRVEWSR